MTLTPKDWGAFQHYKTRSPPWIKLHRKLLDNFDFARLPVASRALAPMLWILASEYQDGKITATVEEMAFRFRTSVDEIEGAITPLVQSGFFVASDTIAARKHDASNAQATSTSRDRGRDREESHPSEDSISSEEGVWQ